ncbi:uridine kinase [Hathewaya proteolytica DSM 3090]|uniref:Uridine kinase n=1 Tax=Hathewaya proteolytica DSM 3090 TaxID=1121331 RepID=A0A1M6NA19_9CLOT|nr:nucleoside kinase [Hathewaya proteolytica]SHJ92504.1 uridine kinase [Hathewaya proteolytica DSM 3090]
MGDIKITLKDVGKNIVVDDSISFYEIMRKYEIEKENPIILCKYNEEYYELSQCPECHGVLEYITNSNDLARRAYVRTLQFVLVKAVKNLYKSSQLDIEHSLSKGLYCEIHGIEGELSKEDIERIEKHMEYIIQKDIKIEKLKVTREEAIDIFTKQNMMDKVMLLESISKEIVTLYKLEGLYDYFYGHMAYSTGDVSLFEIRKYSQGFILRFPTVDEPYKVPEFVEHRKLAKIFRESEAWADILGIPHVGALNKIIDDNEMKRLILISEAFHEKKLAHIADMIHEKDSVKLVLIAGPSSSGKTTFTKRLGIQLQVNGLKPVQISMDDFFVDREFTPKDDNGNYDFESIDALDIDLFNRSIKSILDGIETEIPTFNFKTGKKEWLGHKIKLPKNGILMIEGIHGLNERMTSTIPRDQKFKIYISCLTHLNIDNHNRIHTTDVRMMRRMVRDSLSRGYSAEDTMAMWPSVRRGEKKNIYVFEDESDVMFNSTLVYELCVLKKYALEELKKVNKDSEYYNDAKRLISFLNFFREIDRELVPDNSILKEFIGGSCFYNY